jgi:hypothetical protein
MFVQFFDDAQHALVQPLVILAPVPIHPAANFSFALSA